MELNKPIPSTAFPAKNKMKFVPHQEPMFYLNEDFRCDSAYVHWKTKNGKAIPGSSSYIMARMTVVEKLKDAESFLPDGYHFLIYDAYRPIVVQQELWNYYKTKTIKKLKKENKDREFIYTKEDIEKETSYYVSKPSYNILSPSLHNTGGAVDLTIIDENDNILNMGCKYDEFDEKSWSDYYELIDDNDADDEILEIKKNRRMLYNIMTQAGFTNLPSEIWHYDYGDEMWAYFTHSSPIYAGILDASVKGSTDYYKKDAIREFDLKQQLECNAIMSSNEACERFSREIEYIVNSDNSIRK